jgi:hypothetical protein
MQKLLECYSVQLDRLALGANGVLTGHSTGNSPFWLLDKRELDAGKESLNKMLQPLQDRDLQSRRPIMAGSKTTSVGRWRQEMPSAASKLFVAHSEIIDRLGYPLHDV